MKDSHVADMQSFLYPRSHYYGQGTPAHLDFNHGVRRAECFFFAPALTASRTKTFSTPRCACAR
jgi:hypothetical protein